MSWSTGDSFVDLSSSACVSTGTTSAPSLPVSFSRTMNSFDLNHWFPPVADNSFPGMADEFADKEVDTCSLLAEAARDLSVFIIANIISRECHRWGRERSIFELERKIL